MPATRTHFQHTTLFHHSGAGSTRLGASRWQRDGGGGVDFDIGADFGAVGDEEARQLRDSLATLAAHIEAAVRTRRDGTDAVAIAQQAQDFAQCLRAHQLLLTGLGSAWHALYEFGAYQSALRTLRHALGAWQHQLASRNSLSERAHFERFELLAWRALGESLLLQDMYRQGCGRSRGAKAGAPSTLSMHSTVFMAGGARRRFTALQRAHAWWARWQRR
jgi:hypothetical protein